MLLNSGYQLLNYVINERLKRIVEQTDVLESGQGGGRQGRSVNINMQKMHFVTHKAHRQGKRVYRVDIDCKNAFNAMSHAALWHVMNMFHIPHVDLLEQNYDSITVRLAPNDAESATITFDTGVAQGSITSLQLLNIFINALLRMLKATGQNQVIRNTQWCKQKNYLKVIRITQWGKQTYFGPAQGSIMNQWQKKLLIHETKF